MTNRNKKKKVLVLLGSPRKNGNSTILAQEIAKGAEAEGAEIESLYIHGMDIRPCQACWVCQDPAAEGCIIKDDMQTVFPRMIEADAWVIATPIHWFNMSAQTKLWMDRCFALPRYGKDPFNKKIGIAMTYGDADPYISGGINAIRCFQDTFRYLGSKIEGFVYGSALKSGEIAQNEAVLKAAKELGYKLAE